MNGKIGKTLCHAMNACIETLAVCRVCTRLCVGAASADDDDGSG